VPDVGPSAARVADGQITNLPVGRQVAEENEIPEPALKRLRVERGVEHAHVETGGGFDVRHDDVQVIQLRRVQRQQADGQRLRPRGRRQERQRNRRSEAGHEIAPLHAHPLSHGER
jgi:hypothetical protein